MAERMKAVTMFVPSSHASLVSHARQTAGLILRASAGHARQAPKQPRQLCEAILLSTRFWVHSAAFAARASITAMFRIRLSGSAWRCWR